MVKSGMCLLTLHYLLTVISAISIQAFITVSCNLNDGKCMLSLEEHGVVFAPTENKHILGGVLFIYCFLKCIPLFLI